MMMVKNDYKSAGTSILSDPWFSCTITASQTIPKQEIHVVPSGLIEQFTRTSATIDGVELAATGESSVFCRETVTSSTFEFFYGDSQVIIDPDDVSVCLQNVEQSICDEIVPFAAWVRDQTTFEGLTAIATFPGVSDAFTLTQDRVLLARISYKTDRRSASSNTFEIQAKKSQECAWITNEVPDEIELGRLPQGVPLSDSGVNEIGGFTLYQPVFGDDCFGAKIDKTRLKFQYGDNSPFFVTSDMTCADQPTWDECKEDVFLLANYLTETLKFDASTGVAQLPQ